MKRSQPYKNLGEKLGQGSPDLGNKLYMFEELYKSLGGWDRGELETRGQTDRQYSGQVIQAVGTTVKSLDYFLNEV